MLLLWSRWRLSTLLYFFSLSERIFGENTTNIVKSNIGNCVSLKHIVFGYNIFDKDYFDFYISISEQKTKQVSIYSLFVRKYTSRLSQVQNLQNCQLSIKIMKNIEMYIYIYVYMPTYVFRCKYIFKGKFN